MPPWELIVGAGGGFVFAAFVANILWKAHLAADKREQDRADRAETDLREIIAELRAALRNADPK